MASGDSSFDATRRAWLAQVSAALAASPQALAQAGANPSRPNIILIISDQFRWDAIGAMGINPMNLTPNLDESPDAICPPDCFRSSQDNSIGCGCENGGS